MTMLEMLGKSQRFQAFSLTSIVTVFVVEATEFTEMGKINGHVPLEEELAGVLLSPPLPGWITPLEHRL
jgi:hypothetical protein